MSACERAGPVSAVACGREDRLIPPVYADRWLELVPQAKKVVIDDAGHMLPHEQPDAAAEAITAFLG